MANSDVSAAPGPGDEELQLVASLIASFDALDTLVDTDPVVAAGAATQLAERVIAARDLCSSPRSGSFWFDVLDPEITASSPDNILCPNYPRWHVVEVGYGEATLFGFWFEPNDGSEFQYRYFTDRDQADAEALAAAAEAGRRVKGAAELQDECDRLADQFVDLYGAAKAVTLAAWTDRHGRLHGHEAVDALGRVLDGLIAQPQVRENMRPWAWWIGGREIPLIVTTEEKADWWTASGARVTPLVPINLPSPDVLRVASLNAAAALEVMGKSEAVTVIGARDLKAEALTVADRLRQALSAPQTEQGTK